MIDKEELKYQLKKAISLFKRFTGHDPTRKEVKFLKADETVLRVGKLKAIIYETKRDGVRESYIHKFTSRPDLFVSFDGNRIYITSGSYKFTEKGFEK